MKKVIITVAVFVFCFATTVMAAENIATGVLAGCTLTGNPDRPSNLGEADLPPYGAKVDIVDNGNGTRTVSFNGFPEIFKGSVELYGKKGIAVCPLQGGQRTYPAGMWLNTSFKGADGNFHYILVTDEYRVIRQPWMGDGVGVMPNFGRGSALVYFGDLRKEYR